MKGRRSSDQNYVFGYPCEFLGNIFPKYKEVVSHAHLLRRQNTSLGLWKKNTPTSVVAKAVTKDIFAIWGETEIPCFGTTCVEDRVERLLARAKKVLQVPGERRNESELAQIWGSLFDISLCPHKELKLCDCPNCHSPHPQPCDCSPESKVPEIWRDFLWDQRGPRLQCLGGIDRKKTKLDLVKSELDLERSERREREEERAAIFKLKSEQDQVDAKAPIEDLVDSQGERLSQGLTLDDESDDEESDWEEGGERGCGGENGGGEGDVREYNTLNLPRFSRDLDRYKVSNRAGAKLGNSLLKDLGVVDERNLQLLLCPTKIVRQRVKHGKLSAETLEAKPPPGISHQPGESMLNKFSIF